MTRRTNPILEQMTDEAESRLRDALHAAPIEPQALRALIHSDKDAAARQLATLTEHQLVNMSVHYASFLNELYGRTEPGETVTSEAILANFQAGIAKLPAPAAESAPEPFADWARIAGSDPVIVALATALRLATPGDAALGRAIEKLIDQPEIAYEFDGVELRVVSFDPKGAMWYATDGTGCTCKGARHPWCKHRVLHRVLMAYQSLTAPAVLRDAIVAQQEPGGAPDAGEAAGYDEYGDPVYLVTTYELSRAA